MRRTTLGPVSSSAANSRGVVGPGRAPASVLKRHADRRASAVPSFGGRRHSSMAPSSHLPSGRRQSSIPGHRGTSLAYAGRRTDPRPSNDRAYMQACVQSIVGFVVENGYGMPISPKILTNPTSKDFQNIFLFLMRYLDPTFKFEKRFEDEIPALLKSLGYPFTVSKSALSAVGSPHTWPALLAVLTWLLEMLQYDEKKLAREVEAANGATLDSDSDALDPVGQSNEDAKFLNNVNAAYCEFLAGADEFPELDEALRDDFEAENAGVREDVLRLEAEVDESSETLVALRAQPSQLQTLKEHHTSLDSNIRKFKRLIPSLLEHKSGVEAKLAEKANDIDQLQESIASMSEEIEELRAIVEVQEQNAIDPERIAKDRANLKEMLAKLQDERNKAELDLKVAEDRLSRETLAVCDNLRRYNRGAETLKSLCSSAITSEIKYIPTTVSDVNGAEFGDSTVSSNEFDHVSLEAKQIPKSAHHILSAELPQSLQHNSWKENVLPPLRDLKDAFCQRYVALQSDELTLQEKLDAIEERLMVVRDEHSKQQSRFAKYDREYQAEKSAMAEQLKVGSDEVLRREEEITDRRRRRDDNLRESERNLETLNAQLRSFQENFGTESLRLSTVILAHIEKMRRHNTSIHDATQVAARHFADEMSRCDLESHQDTTMSNHQPGD